MSKSMDTKEILKLQEADDGNYLIINNGEPIKIIVENGKILNNLTEKQLSFVKDYV